MHPIALIELMIVLAILFIIVLVSFLLKGKWKKLAQRLAILYLVSFGVLTVVRPYWIDRQIEIKISYIQMHLEEQYPGETWRYWTVPHREEGYEHMNPYHIGVIFDKEPEVKYIYYAQKKNHIIQSGYSSEKDLMDLLHVEILEE